MNPNRKKENLPQFIDVNAILNEVIILPYVKTVGNRKGSYFLNIPAAFDVETSSFEDNGDKCSLMYVWQFGVGDIIIIGRLWADFIALLDFISHKYKLDKKTRLIVYVHNLSYEFQFMRKYFEWYKVFAVDNRRPVYAITDTGIEFRCSYILSGYSLELVAKNLVKYKVEKRVGDLDYTKIRTPKTPLTSLELGYCINDIKVILSYIQERIEQDGNISKIPLTQTGYVRKYCRENTSDYPDEGVKRRYRLLMQELKLEPDEFLQARSAFAGGFTHCSFYYSGDTCLNVASYDFTSSYPAVMLSEPFPMSKGELVDIHNSDDFRFNLEIYCCLFDLEIYNLRPKIKNEHIISESKCIKCLNTVTDNGRVVSADYILISCTEVDFKGFEMYYDWDEIRVGNFRRYRKCYLPTAFVKCILKLYFDKTELKGVKGYEAEYMHSKEMLNSAYGMCVTNFIKDENIYIDDWETNPADFDKCLFDENENKSRFLFYLWGIYVTAYARYNLFRAIAACGDDYIYSDTDSVKIMNAERHKAFFESYNNEIKEKVKTAMSVHGITDFVPRTKEGKIKHIGVWEYEETYKKFKSLGAKRYIFEHENGEIEITVSGISKKVGSKYLSNKFKDPFEAFADGLIFPAEGTGKNTLTYIDDEQQGIVVDYLGQPYEYKTLSGVHMSGCEYALDRSILYLRYLMGQSIIMK